MYILRDGYFKIAYCVPFSANVTSSPASSSSTGITSQLACTQVGSEYLRVSGWAHQQNLGEDSLPLDKESLFELYWPWVLLKDPRLPRAEAHYFRHAGQVSIDKHENPVPQDEVPVQPVHSDDAAIPQVIQNIATYLRLRQLEFAAGPETSDTVKLSAATIGPVAANGLNLTTPTPVINAITTAADGASAVIASVLTTATVTAVIAAASDTDIAPPVNQVAVGSQRASPNRRPHKMFMPPNKYRTKVYTIPDKYPPPCNSLPPLPYSPKKKKRKNLPFIYNQSSR
ncbi:hypothetical protein BGZ46_008888 [Entomortierella lignicola]|nr:hypothetical protein BGZ46_008888 [Entomortierella lignicola]